MGVGVVYRAIDPIGIKGANGTSIASNANPVPVSDAGGALTVDGTVAVSSISATDLDIRDLAFATDKVDASGSSIAVSNFPASQAVSQGTAAAVAGSWPVKVTDGTDTAQVTAAGALTVDGSGTTQPVSAASLPLPTGASTSALQTTGNTSLSSIDGKLPALDGGRIPVTLGTTEVEVKNDANSPLPVSGTVAVSNSTFPTGAEKAEDAAHSSGDQGYMLLVVRKDAAGTLAGTDGDYAPLQVDSSGNLRVIATPGVVTGALQAGAQTAVDGTAGGVLIFTADANAKLVIIQNVGSATMRVGPSGVTATTGAQILPGGSWDFGGVVPTNNIYAIREGAINTTALAQKMT